MIEKYVFLLGALALLVPVSHAVDSVQELPPENNAYSLKENFDFEQPDDAIAATHEFVLFGTGSASDTLMSESMPSLHPEFEEPLKYQSADEGAVAAGKAEGSWLENTSSALPKKRGIKSMMIGLLIMVLMFSLNELSYLAIESDEYAHYGYQMTNAFESLDEKLSEIFRFDPVSALELLTAGAALFLSGLASYTQSVLKRRQAKKGLAVDNMPPLRGLVELLGGLVLMGIWAISPDVGSNFDFLSDVAFSIIIVGAVLLPLSLIQRFVHRIRNRASVSESPFELTELPEQH